MGAKEIIKAEITTEDLQEVIARRVIGETIPRSEHEKKYGNFSEDLTAEQLNTSWRKVLHASKDKLLV